MNKHMRLFALLILGALMTAFVTPLRAQSEIRQWASYAEATSQYSSTDWSAAKATGAPNAMSSCSDHVEAWASATISSSETLTLYYDVPVQPTQVNIYQNYNPGAITSVELIPAQGDYTVPIPNSYDRSTRCPGVFSLDVNMGINVIGVVIRLDQTITGGWNEIDAVELVGYSTRSGPTPRNNGPGGNLVPSNPGNQYTPNSQMGVNVTCPNGLEITNGVEVAVIQMRSGYDYTATAIGINGFDPVIALLNDSGQAELCNDDESAARNFSADLPTTGYIAPSSTTAQQSFSNNQPNLSDVSIVVGSYSEGGTGEFLIVLEGMAFTESDNAGDPFSMLITPGMLASGIDPTAYMISVNANLDAYISLIDEDYNIFVDNYGNQIMYCDDAGTTLCDGYSVGLDGYYVSRANGSTLGGFGYDAMLNVPIEYGDEYQYLNFLMHSSSYASHGYYVVAFHLGIGNGYGGAGDA
jgi:hypothetical protein